MKQVELIYQKLPDIIRDISQPPTTHLKDDLNDVLIDSILDSVLVDGPLKEYIAFIHFYQKQKQNTWVYHLQKAMECTNAFDSFEEQILPNSRTVIFLFSRISFVSVLNTTDTNKTDVAKYMTTHDVVYCEGNFAILLSEVLNTFVEVLPSTAFTFEFYQKMLLYAFMDRFDIFQLVEKSLPNNDISLLLSSFCDTSYLQLLKKNHLKYRKSVLWPFLDFFLVNNNTPLSCYQNSSEMISLYITHLSHLPVISTEEDQCREFLKNYTCNRKSLMVLPNTLHAIPRVNFEKGVHYLLQSVNTENVKRIQSKYKTIDEALTSIKSFDKCVRGSTTTLLWISYDIDKEEVAIAQFLHKLHNLSVSDQLLTLLSLCEVTMTYDTCALLLEKNMGVEYVKRRIETKLDHINKCLKILGEMKNRAELYHIIFALKHMAKTFPVPQWLPLLFAIELSKPELFDIVQFTLIETITLETIPNYQLIEILKSGLVGDELTVAVLIEAMKCVQNNCYKRALQICRCKEAMTDSRVILLEYLISFKSGEVFLGNVVERYKSSTHPLPDVFQLLKLLSKTPSNASNGCSPLTSPKQIAENSPIFDELHLFKENQKCWSITGEFNQIVLKTNERLKGMNVMKGLEFVNVDALRTVMQCYDVRLLKSVEPVPSFVGFDKKFYISSLFRTVKQSSVDVVKWRALYRLLEISGNMPLEIAM
ncbi:hypothetical protein EIN_229790 [Entamoeba invadens IP1]|uniref:Uncharacterized protein n=1 Tax=Entamoeba invadens IP1 TaxID=370355 RepID=A0A0A1U306_ENTIV|nr:hypothetical protein EIN_229790 [Entamoeba invadens IP1]ELP88446.1 hypothetical protein EIN_229790 [Entamoeba invadens IP1]|eukprot:XP_004255217.1 hypothetical protein EIN_229790 [Entamoeba invadens IP1]